MKRVVIDTGVVVSGLLKKDGTSRKSFILAMEYCQPLISMATLTEMSDVLSRSKFSRVFTREDIISVMALIVDRSEIIEVKSTNSVCRDSNDNKFINLAIDGQAEVIITRDADLLVLHPFREVCLLTPADFILWFDANKNSVKG